jgi:hypothetical protein
MTPVRVCVVRPLLWALLWASFGLSCLGRDHTQREGTYQFRADQLFQDDCRIKSGDTVLWSGTLAISGDLLRVQLDGGLFNMQLAGRYLNNVERFTLDGSAVDVTGTVGSSQCLFTLVQAHLDATTKDERTFSGTAQVHYQSRTPACVCDLSAMYTAILR